MSASSFDRSTMYGAAAATLLAALAGGGASLAVAVAFWPNPPDFAAGASAFFPLACGGAWVGAVTGLAVGAILGFHGGTLGAAAETRSLAAPLWGILAGLVVGASLGPVFAAVASVAVGYFLDSSAYFALAALFGFFAGPLLGVVAWEAGYWLADFLRATRSSHE